MIIHLLQTSVNEKDTDSNFRKAVDLFKNNVPDNGGLVVLPELFIPGYKEENIYEWATRSEEVIKKFSALCKEKNTALILGTISINDNGKRYNRSIFIDDNGEIVGKYNKTHLFKLLKEDIYFKQGDDLPVFEYKGWKIGINICYDLRFPESIRALYRKGADLIILPAAWPHARTDVFKKLCFARAIENQCYFVTCNRASHSLEKPTYAGNSMIIAPDGELVAECNELDDYKSADIDINNVIEYRKQITCLDDRREDLY
ncbi:MAG: carbon-nitrogen family hydrolase [Candidatus Delongbacteria bacterium]|nr:carbon-nitrogen family hydrolase [Candidatus Delongbacteria bacterium]